MAYVAVTDKVVNEIRKKISDMREAEFKTLGSIKDEIDKIMLIPELYNEIEKAAWGEFYDLRDRLKDRLSWKGYVELGFYHNVQEEPVAYTEPVTYISVNVPKFPFGLLQNEYASMYVINSFRYTFPSDHYHAQVRRVMELFGEHAEIKKRWEKVERQVVMFVRNTKSINEAVKLWPDIKAYLTSRIIEKLEEKTTPKTTAPISAAATLLENMDIETIKQSAVIGKLLIK